MSEPYFAVQVREWHEAQEEIATLRSLLSEWIEKPHSYGQKKELLERTALIVEGWEEV